MAKDLRPCFTRVALVMRVSSAFVWCVVSVVAGCHRAPAVEDRQVPPATAYAPRSERTSAARPPDAGVVVGSGGERHVRLDLSTRRAMKILPHAVADQRLAFGKGRLGVLGDDAVVVRSTRDFSEVARLPLTRPLSLSGLADGSLLAIGAAESLRLLPADTRPKQVRHLFVFPRAFVFGDRRAVDRAWMLGQGTTLFGYDLDTTHVGPDDWISLDGYDDRAFASLTDGSFFYTTPAGFAQCWGPHAKHPVSGDVQGVFRVLPASRPDTLWELRPHSAGLYRVLAGKMYRLKQVDLPILPYEVDAEGEYLAVLELAQPSDAPWRFTLEVFDVHGARRMTQTLPASESLDEDWVERLGEERHLAVSADPPLVAVGGPKELSVWNAKTGDRVYAGR